METNLVLAGVGGQGILSIARALSDAAMTLGLQVKQAEVHGMSQRGGEVQSHLRLSDRAPASDLIPLGRADLVLAVEPLEALRYVQYLGAEGVVIANTRPVVNMSNYPPLEQVLDRIAGLPQHVLLDAERLAQLAGTARAANMVLLGAASWFVPLAPELIEEAVGRMFAAKGPHVAHVNRRAFRLGRAACAAYREGLARGAPPAAARRWVEQLTVEQLEAGTTPGAPAGAAESDGDALSAAETRALASALQHVHDTGREQLYEHEVYTLLELVGAILPPRYVFVPRGGAIDGRTLSLFPGERVVLKIVSPDIVHKSDVAAVLFVPKALEVVQRELRRLVGAPKPRGQGAGVLIVEYVEPEDPGFGHELFVGIRATREFGPVIAAGLGGVDTEYLAARMRPGVAVAKAVAADIDAEGFLELFRQTAAYEVLSGRVRGHRRVVSDGELLRCFRAFLAIARTFCVPRGPDVPSLVELEVNPFAFRRQRLVPLDGRARLGACVEAPLPRPLERVERLLTPRSIAVLGASSTTMNVGRIILNNVQRCGFPAEHLYVVKNDGQPVDGARAAPNIASLPQPLDLLVVAAPAAQLPAIIEDINRSDVQSVILISGGVGETHGTDALRDQVRQAIAQGRQRPGGGPVYLGPNSLGVLSRPGRFNTFFIPPDKLDLRLEAPARRAALISQSGAFIITRLSNLETLDPAIAVSIGNQLDLTIADALSAVARRGDIDVIGVYTEGFNDLDGAAFLRAVREARAAGKLIVFYKAGRTESGRSAAAGHTAAVAGDYDVCQSAAAQAGAVVVDTFKEFEQLLELGVALHAKDVRGPRIAAISNAGFETVGMADTIRGARYELSMAALSPETQARLREVLRRQRVEHLVNAQNPLDLTPMSSEAAYEATVRVLAEADEVDALVVSIVPLAGQLLTTAAEIESPDSLAARVPRLFASIAKPLILVVDCGPPYDALVRAVRSAGVPVFRTCDQAIRSLGRYLCHRAPLEPADDRSGVTGTAQPRAATAQPAEQTVVAATAGASRGSS